MFVPSGAFASAVTRAPSRSKTPGAIAEKAPFAQSTAIRRPAEVGAEVLDDVLDVPLDGVVRLLDRAAARPARVEERLDLELVRVGQLVALAVEDLDAVVLRRVVRGRDDEPEILREQRDRGCRQHAREHGGAAGLDDPARQRGLELRTRCRGCRGRRARGSATGPQRRGAAEPLDEVLGQRLADDAAHAVRAEVAAHCGADPRPPHLPCPEILVHDGEHARALLPGRSSTVSERG